jgi:hypothetical protein
MMRKTDEIASGGGLVSARGCLEDAVDYLVLVGPVATTDIGE